MGYIEENLMPGEEVIYRAQLHWIIFFWPAFFLVALIVLLGSFAMGSPPAELAGVFLILLALVVATGLNSYINFKTSEFGLTTKRVMMKVGWIRRHSIETLLNKVEGIQVTQGISGRILGFGTIIITGTGGGKEPFKMITDPLAFRKKVQEQIATLAG